MHDTRQIYLNIKIGLKSAIPHELLSNELVSKRVKLLLLKKNCGTMTLDL